MLARLLLLTILLTIPILPMLIASKHFNNTQDQTLDNIQSCIAHGGTPIHIYNERGELVDNLCNMED